MISEGNYVIEYGDPGDKKGVKDPKGFYEENRGYRPLL